MDAAETVDQLREKVADVLADVMVGHMPTKWLLLVEAIDVEDGERALWSASPQEVPEWDLLGLCEYRSAQSRSLLTARDK